MPHDITSLKCHSRLKFHGLKYQSIPHTEPSYGLE